MPLHPLPRTPLPQTPTSTHVRMRPAHACMLCQVRNQKDRDAYERAWQQSLQQGDEFQQRWGRAKVQRDGRDWGM